MGYCLPEDKEQRKKSKKSRRVPSLFCILYLLSFLCLYSVHATAFLAGSEDVPLMEGMKGEDAPAIFDKKEGQVMVSKVITGETRSGILSFYQEALPNLGWIKQSLHVYKRKNQTLTLSLKKLKTKYQVTFTLVEAN